MSPQWPLVGVAWPFPLLLIVSCHLNGSPPNSPDRNAPWGQRSLPWGPTDQPWGQTTPALRRSSTGLRTTSTRGTDNHPSQRLMLICRTIVCNCLSANLTAGLGSCHLLWMRWWMAGKPLLEILWVEHIAKDVVSVERIPQIKMINKTKKYISVTSHSE